MRAFRATLQFDPGRGRWVATVGELAEAEGLTAEQALAVLRLHLSAVAVEQLARGLALPEGPAEGMPVALGATPAPRGSTRLAVRRLQAGRCAEDGGAELGGQQGGEQGQGLGVGQGEAPARALGADGAQRLAEVDELVQALLQGRLLRQRHHPRQAGRVPVPCAGVNTPPGSSGSSGGSSGGPAPAVSTAPRPGQDRRVCRAGGMDPGRRRGCVVPRLG